VSTEPLTLCVLLWSHPGEEDGLTAYEDTVLGLLAQHGGVVASRVRRKHAGDGPLEVHVIEFADRAGMDAYLSDPRRLASAELRERVVARTEVFEVDRRYPRDAADN
jgi:antibiotic biosynthesis monooxygenase (ABM) superfamily enzyme